MWEVYVATVMNFHLGKNEKLGFILPHNIKTSLLRKFHSFHDAYSCGQYKVGQVLMQIFAKF
jgi:hypothetical protein